MANYPRSYTTWMRRLTPALFVGPLLFTLTWLLLGAISKGYTMWDITVSGYSPISQPISGLGLGDTALYMNTAFVAYGLLVIFGAFGAFRLIRELSPGRQLVYSVLLSLHGIGAALCGLFDLESIMLHSLGFFLVISPVVTFPIIGTGLRRIKRWQTFGTWMRWGGLVTLVLSVLYFASFNPERAGENLGIAGLTQRVLVLQIFAWLAAFGWLTIRRYPSSS